MVYPLIMPLKKIVFLDPKKKESMHLETMARKCQIFDIMWPNDQTQFRVEIRAYKILDLGRSSQAHDVKPDDFVSY